jgi:hypothetical protein
MFVGRSASDDARAAAVTVQTGVTVGLVGLSGGDAAYVVIQGAQRAGTEGAGCDGAECA